MTGYAPAQAMGGRPQARRDAQTRMQSGGFALEHGIERQTPRLGGLKGGVITEERRLGQILRRRADGGRNAPRQSAQVALQVDGGSDGAIPEEIVEGLLGALRTDMQMIAREAAIEEFVGKSGREIGEHLFLLPIMLRRRMATGSNRPPGTRRRRRAAWRLEPS